MTAHIMVVDDEPMIRMLLLNLLEADGYTVSEAEDGLDALNKARREAPDLILIDYMMPRMDGLEATIRLRETPETAAVPIIMITANSQSTVREQCLKAGVDRFLDKADNLVTEISRHIQELLRAANRQVALQRPPR